MERPVEGARTGVAIDGSSSMKGPFGKLLLGNASQEDIDFYTKQDMVHHSEQDGRKYLVWTEQAVKELVDRGVYRYSENIVEPQARRMTEYLSRFDAIGGTTVIYWALGDGRQIEIVGDLTRDQCPETDFKGPKHFGNATHLLPAIQYFVDRFADARWGYVCIYHRWSFG